MGFLHLEIRKSIERDRDWQFRDEKVVELLYNGIVKCGMKEVGGFYSGRRFLCIVKWSYNYTIGFFIRR